ncbi:hypothetical protein [Deinococcus radiophilus]|uniref:hypothetical protein n=1 Tax=Deinococcus radiophilus TaxID=32062 RepID=UPI00361F221C
MELNAIGAHASPFTLKKAAFEDGAATARPLLEYAISEEAVWGCTTCGPACRSARCRTSRCWTSWTFAATW